MRRHRLPEGTPVSLPKVVAGVEAVPGLLLSADVKDPTARTQGVHRDADAGDDDVEDDGDAEEVGREDELVREAKRDEPEQDGEHERQGP